MSRLRAAFGTALFTVLVPAMVAGVIPALIAPALRGPLLLRAAGWVLVAIGGAAYLWCAVDFVMVGRGTPAPIDAPRVLVARGLYRYSRNPMYVAVLVVVAGQALVRGSARVALYALLLWLLFSAFVRGYEEPRLAARFGAAYELYRSRVPRWVGGARRPGAGGG